MEWVFSVLVASLMVPPEEGGSGAVADAVYCDARYQTRQGRAFRIFPDCPDVENRDDMEDQVRRQLREAYPALRDLSIRDMTGRIFFVLEHTEDGLHWRIQPGVITRINAYYPLNAYESGISGACTATFDVIDGTPENICMRCRASDFRGEFFREIRRSIRRSFYVDTDVPNHQTIRVDFPHPDNPSPGFPDVPDCSDNED